MGVRTLRPLSRLRLLVMRRASLMVRRPEEQRRRRDSVQVEEDREVREALDVALVVAHAASYVAAGAEDGDVVVEQVHLPSVGSPAEQSRTVSLRLSPRPLRLRLRHPPRPRFLHLLRRPLHRQQRLRAVLHNSADGAELK